MFIHDANLLGSKLVKGIQNNTLWPRNINQVNSNIERGRVAGEGSRRRDDREQGNAATPSEGT